MSKNIRLVVNKKGGKGSQALAKALHIKRIKCQEYWQDARDNYPVIGWGHSRSSIIYGLNQGHAVNNAADKRLTFKLLESHGVPTVKWTLDKAVAEGWFKKGLTVVARTKVRAACGRGLVLCKLGHPEANTAVIAAPLYTRYMNKDRELRIHVFNGTVIATAEKKRKRGFIRGLYQRLVQSHENGWVFCTKEVQVPDKAKDVALQAVKALGLDFGAVDVIMRKGKVYVLECNSAPGLEGQTLTAYVKAFKEYINEHNNINPDNPGGIGLQRKPKINQGRNPRRKQRAG
jgi:glutathione synthase/RimK-type ligase-like ATP-grasp enzyme